MLRKLFGFHDIEVKGQMLVGTLQKNFEESFGTKIKVYKPTADGKINTGKGSRLAAPKSTLASNCIAGKKVSDIMIRKGYTVGAVEKTFAEQMGIGIQILTPDGKSFAPDTMQLGDVAGFAGK